MLLELNDVSKSFGGVAALTGISFGVKQGEVLVLSDQMVLVRLHSLT